jgi:hypothetical protein
MGQAFREVWDECGSQRSRLRLVMVRDGPPREDVTPALAGSEAATVTWLPLSRYLDSYDYVLRVKRPSER